MLNVKKLIKPLAVEYIPGFLYGLKYPSIKLSFSSGDIDDHQNLFYDFLIPYLETHKWKPSLNNSYDLKFIALLNTFMKFNHAHIRLPVYDEIFSIHKDGLILLYLPTLQSFQKPVLDLISIFIEATNNFNEENFKQLHAAFLHKALRLIPKKTIIPYLVKAAFEANIYFNELFVNTYQFGLGKKYFFFDHQVSSGNSMIGHNIAKNKVLSYSLIRAAGFSTPINYGISNLESAEKITSKIGYPVILKCFGQDNHNYVSGNLNSFDDIKKTFSEVKKTYKNIFLEKVYKNKRYKLVIYKSKLVWAWEIAPIILFGNGKDTIENLMGRLDGLKDQRFHSLSEEKLKEMILKNKLEPTFILEKDRSIVFSHLSAIDLDGDKTNTSHKVHPHNVDLAIKVTNTVGLDFSVVDIGIEDIAESYLNIPATIFEVTPFNIDAERPFPRLYKNIIRTIHEEQNSTKVIFVIGNIDIEAFVKNVKNVTMEQKIKLAFVSNKNFYSNNQFLKNPQVTLLKTTNSLIRDKDLDMLFINIDDDSILYSGMPTSIIDHIILFNDQISLSAESVKLLPDLNIKNTLFECLIRQMNEKGSLFNMKDSGWQLENFSVNYNFSPSIIESDNLKHVFNECLFNKELST